MVFPSDQYFFEDILRAVNLGDDADTTTAVCSQVAGAFYGKSNIPDRWLKKLTLYQEIRNLADRLSGHIKTLFWVLTATRILIKSRYSPKSFSSKTLLH